MGRYRYTFRVFVLTTLWSILCHADCTFLSSLIPEINTDIRPRLKTSSTHEVMVSQLVDPRTPGIKILDNVGRLAARTLGLAQLSKIYRAVLQDGRTDVPTVQKLLDAMSVTVSHNPNELTHIPKEGPLLIVANHPLLGLDSMSIASLLSKIRSDYKIVMTESLADIPELSPIGISVPPTTIRTPSERWAVLDQCKKWLQEGHALILFPAGAISSIQGENGVPLDPPWSRTAAYLPLETGATVVPIRVLGSPDPHFLHLRRNYPFVSDLFLIRQMMAQKHKQISLKIGRPIYPADLPGSDVEPPRKRREIVTAFLREEVYRLPGE